MNSHRNYNEDEDKSGKKKKKEQCPFDVIGNIAHAMKKLKKKT